MIKNINKGVFRLTLALVSILGHFSLFAQPPGGPPPGGGGATGVTPPCWDPECVPVDGGLVFLIIAGLILGAKLLYSKVNTQVS